MKAAKRTIWKYGISVLWKKVKAIFHLKLRIEDVSFFVRRTRNPKNEHRGARQKNMQKDTRNVSYFGWSRAALLGAIKPSLVYIPRSQRGITRIDFGLGFGVVSFLEQVWLG
jgi:hypothetical protein